MNRNKKSKKRKKGEKLIEFLAKLPPGTAKLFIRKLGL